ncbi:hypothetical protein BpHYR1_021890 [Brachionus plicatilis]|uniref:Uncharacterized protein n=1 Tax=Brachionus plicatilis TaxID=10195 RepID=A0A3M7PRG4_BRAPC|nr:hypothetical protein BpHYR1_021890 [Brachionus plicatilis]
MNQTNRVGNRFVKTGLKPVQRKNGSKMEPVW